VGESAHLELAPNVEACLKALRAAGLPCGIVCDVGLTSAPTLRARLRRFGLLQYFQAWAFSDETGWFKPSAQAFWPALNKLGTSDPSESAHVGDNPRTDIAGAKALGMLSVRYVGLARRSPYDSHGDEGPEADHVIEDFAQLPAVLGV
jgi:putative hydrolase of the HAD superfamily